MNLLRAAPTTIDIAIVGRRAFNDRVERWREAGTFVERGALQMVIHAAASTYISRSRASPQATVALYEFSSRAVKHCDTS